MVDQRHATNLKLYEQYKIDLTDVSRNNIAHELIFYTDSNFIYFSTPPDSILNQGQVNIHLTIEKLIFSLNICGSLRMGIVIIRAN